MLYQQGPSSWYMEQSSEHQVGQGQHMPRCVYAVNIWLTLWTEPRPWTSADLSDNKALQDLACYVYVCTSPPQKEVKAIADYKAALVVQRPFLKPVSKMSYSYTPQTHFCIKFINFFKKVKIKYSSALACEGGQRQISQCLDKWNVSGFHLTQAKKFPAQAMEFEMGRGKQGSEKSLPFLSLSATYLCTAQKNVHSSPKIILW